MKRQARERDPTAPCDDLLPQNGRRDVAVFMVTQRDLFGLLNWLAKNLCFVDGCNNFVFEEALI